MIKKSQGTIDNSYSYLTEKLNVVDTLMSKFSNQLKQFASLTNKIRILQQELKELTITLRTQSKNINLKIENLKESSVLLEAFDPKSEEWRLQYEITKLSDCITELSTIMESKLQESESLIAPSRSKK